MTTPEKKKQASIASFFSPVSRNAAPSAAPNPCPVEQATPLPYKPSLTATPPSTNVLQTKASKRKVKPSDAKPTVEDLDTPKDDKLPTSSATSQLAPESTNVEPEAPSNIASPKTKKRKTKASEKQSNPAAQPQPPASTAIPDPKPPEAPSDAVKPTNVPTKRAAESDVIVIDDSEDNSAKSTPTKEGQDNTPKSRPQRAAASAVRKQEESLEAKAPARKKAKAAAPPEAPPAPVKPALSPVQQQKHDLYQQKLTDVEHLFVALAKGENTDELLQDIYGAHLDVGLNLTPDVLAACQAELSTECTAPTKAWTAVPPLAKTFIARRIQGCMDCLSTLADTIQSEWLAWLKAKTADVACFNASMLEMEIKSMAERVSYGAKPKKAHMFQDTTPRAMWVWEVGAVESYFDDDAVKVIRRVRKQRKRTGHAIKTLDKIVAMIQDGSTDDSKLSLEESKVSKFYVAVEQEMQKAQKRVDVEKQKALEKDLKAQQQVEKEEAKRVDQELKRKEKEETKKKQEALAKEKEEQELLRRRQTWGTFLKKTETKSSDDISRERAAHADSEMARIDQQLGLGDAPGQQNPPTLPAMSSATTRVPVRPGSWSSQRRRHPTLGVKKLLQFHDNYRPAYWGTNSKKARVLRRGRRPLAMVPTLDYTVESDLEWEDDEVGESLSGNDSDDENGDEEDRLDYGDQWLAYEDEVDYIDERPAEDLDGQPATTHKKVAEHHHRPSKLVKLVPRIIENADDMSAYTIVVLLSQPNVVSPLLKVTPPVVQEVVDPAPVEPAPVEAVAPSKPTGITTWLKPKPT